MCSKVVLFVLRKFVIIVIGIGGNGGGKEGMMLDIFSFWLVLLVVFVGLVYYG